MHFNEYQQATAQTAIYPQGLTYPSLGLCGEAGEVAELIKKMHRDDAGILTPERQAKLEKELGDVLWYVSEVARQAGLELNDIALVNLGKLARRAQEGKINGDGSER
jgi:NTP pyrophosphatase (non-canonical NTP hydrolase)